MRLGASERKNQSINNVAANDASMGNLETGIELVSTLDTSVPNMSDLAKKSYVMSTLDKDAPHSLLATARVRVKNGQDSLEEIRVLCDSGAQVNLLSDDTFKRLKLSR